MTAPSGWARRSGPTVNPNLSSGQRKHGGGDQSIWFNFPRPERSGERTETRVRLLPAWTKQPDDPYWFEVVEHFGQITDFDGTKRWKSVVCPETWGERCEAHDARIKLFTESKNRGESKQGDRDSSPYRRHGLDLLPRRRYLVQAILLDDLSRHGDDMTPVVIRLNASVWRQIEDLERYKGSVADWEHGMALKIVIQKTGPQKFNIEYKVFDENRSELDSALWPALENLHDLSALVKRPDDESDVLRVMYPDALAAAQGLSGAPKKKPASSGTSPAGFERKAPAKEAPAPVKFDDDIPF